MPRPPYHRYEDVAKSLDVPGFVHADPAQQALRDVLLRVPNADAAVGYAYDIFRNPAHRAALDAFVLADATPETVQAVVGVAAEVVKKYAYLFMDLGVFRNRLEMLTWASEYDGDAYGKELCRAALTIGIDYLLWAFGKGDADLDARMVVRRTMVDSFYRGLAHRGNGLTAGVTKEAYKWWATAVRNAEILEKIDPRVSKHAAEELKIALESRDDTLKPEDSPVALHEILH
jgi:hypothetical protein